MNLQELKTPLIITDIDFRIQNINKGGYATILAYKNARVDMNRLDMVCGSHKWQRDHKEVHGVVYCGVGIQFGEQWIWKWDAGAESYSDKQKGEASDSFKRACFNWGIGRELYDYPIIQVKLFPNEFVIDNNKVKSTWDLKIKEWTWFNQFHDDKLTYLAAKDQNNKKRFVYGEYKK